MFESRYYEIARQTAEVITKLADPNVRFMDVVLHGSTLRDKDPGDIDFLILHSGATLSSFTIYEEQSAKDGMGVIELDSPARKRRIGLEIYFINRMRQWMEFLM